MLKYLLIVILLFPTITIAETNQLQSVVKKVTEPSWMSKETLRLATIIEPCATGFVNGWIEADKWGARTPLPPNTYHVATFTRNVGLVGMGWLYMANVKTDYIPAWKKVARISGSIILYERAFENTYMLMRHGTDRNRPEFNQRNLVYVEFNHWIPSDAYISFGAHGREWNAGLVAAGAFLSYIGR